MVKQIAAKSLAALLLLGGAWGLLLAVAGIVWIWRELPTVLEQSGQVFTWVDESLGATSAALIVVDDSLKNAKETLAIVQVAAKDTSTSLRNAAHLSGAAGKTAKDTAAMVEDTRTSLEGVRTGMKLVDNMLRILSNIPFIGIEYAPGESLDASIVRVSESLKGLPSSILIVEKDLLSTSQNLDTLRWDIDALESQIQNVDRNISAAQVVMKKYSGLVQSAQSGLDQARTVFPTALNAAARIATGFLLWLAVAQASLLLQAVSLFQKK